ncbi:hypothetical protein V1506DRAFT_553503 [Lipomyces tetrasporus]
MSTPSAQTAITAESSPTRPEENQYQHALDFLAVNEPEQCLRVQLPIEKYEELQRHAQSLYPYVDYCPDTSTVIIYTAPSSLHGMVSAHLQTKIYYAAAVELELSKTPDNGLLHSFNNKKVLALVIETGLTEDYQKLQNDIRLWLHGMHCRTGMLICLEEEPKFKSPRKRRRLTLMAETSKETLFGPYVYDNHTWFRKLASVCVEVHRRVDASGDNQVEPTWLVRDGTFGIRSEAVDFGLTLGDLFPEDESDVADVRSVAVRLSTQDIKELLVDGAERAASYRFQA